MIDMLIPRTPRPLLQSCFGFFCCCFLLFQTALSLHGIIVPDAGLCIYFHLTNEVLVCTFVQPALVHLNCSLGSFLC